MSNKHTPGPWIWTKYDGVSEDMPILKSIDGQDVMDFGNNSNYYPTQGTPPSEQDAKLIAAAPELLEALQGLIKGFESGYRLWATDKIIENANVAIKKATL